MPNNINTQMNWAKPKTELSLTIESLVSYISFSLSTLLLYTQMLHKSVAIKMIQQEMVFCTGSSKVSRLLSKLQIPEKRDIDIIIRSCSLFPLCDRQVSTCSAHLSITKEPGQVHNSGTALHTRVACLDQPTLI